MSRNLLLGASALALIAWATGASPAKAQLADVTVEGPITSIKVESAPLPAALGVGSTVGIIRVMGVDIKVRADALVHTATNDNLGDIDYDPKTPGTDNGLALSRLSTVPMPGRPEAQGFIGGTVIVSGDSLDGYIYARDVFTDLFENVVVGEATAATVTGRAAVNFMDLIPINDWRMPARKPVNIYGFEINPTSITAGTLVSAEGYFSKTADGENLYYHTIEADSASLAMVPDATGVMKYPSNVSILRADCRIRGRGRDEISVRGGVHSPATGSVQIQIPNLATPDPTDWSTVGTSAPAVADPLSGTPTQGEYRFDNTRQNFNGTCPTMIRALYTASANSLANTAEKAPDIR